MPERPLLVDELLGAGLNLGAPCQEDGDRIAISAKNQLG
jgi:hypothetical protein